MADLSVLISGLTFPTPVFTGAGPNVRDHKIINAALEWGLGGIVSKTFSTEAAEYPRPAMAKTSGGGLLNCETWSDKTMEVCIEDYRKIKRGVAPFVVSIGYSKEDMKILGPLVEKELKPDAIEFSTHYQDQTVEELVEVARALKESVSLPVWMKLSPGNPFMGEIVSQTEKVVDGYVAINSMGPGLDFHLDTKKPLLGSRHGYGWLSGPSIRPIALQTVHAVRQLTDKPIVGVGGVESGEDALKFIMAGASAVQVCTAAIRNGPKIYNAIAMEMDSWLDDNGYKSIRDVKDLYNK